MDEKKMALDIRDLTIHFDVDGQVVRAVNNVNLQLESGKTLGLVGETGAGKTTTALAALKLVPSPPGIIESGEIYVDGINIMKASTRELRNIRGKEVSMIFQDPMTVLNPVMRVGDQIAESVILHSNCSKVEGFRRAVEMLKMVGIDEERARDYPHQFSGGMKQRVVIAVALACNPKLLIADEPTTALDVTIQAQVLKLMKELREKHGTSMVMITHDLGIVAEICDDVAVMYAGRIIECGTAEDVFDRTMHPYTEGLFNSLPNIEKRTEKLRPIPGLMPDPTNLPDGCAFAPRCRYATEACKKGVPPLQEVSATHKVACTRYQEKGFRIERGNRNE